MATLGAAACTGVRPPLIYTVTRLRILHAVLDVKLMWESVSFGENPNPGGKGLSTPGFDSSVR